MYLLKGESPADCVFVHGEGVAFYFWSKTPKVIYKRNLKPLIGFRLLSIETKKRLQAVYGQHIHDGTIHGKSQAWDGE